MYPQTTPTHPNIILVSHDITPIHNNITPICHTVIPIYNNIIPIYKNIIPIQMITFFPYIISLFPCTLTLFPCTHYPSVSQHYSQLSQHAFGAEGSHRTHPPNPGSHLLRAAAPGPPWTSWPCSSAWCFAEREGGRGQNPPKIHGKPPCLGLQCRM